MTADYQSGYNATYAEIYAAIDSEAHPASCGGECLPCGLIRTALEDSMARIGARLTPTEFDALAAMLVRLNQEPR